jgi:hypothetical protein
MVSLPAHLASKSHRLDWVFEREPDLMLLATGNPFVVQSQFKEHSCP